MGGTLNLLDAISALSLALDLGRCKSMSGLVPRRRCGAGKKKTTESRPMRSRQGWYYCGPNQHNIADSQ